MPVTINVNHLALETRVITDPAAHLTEPYDSILTRQLAVATAKVEGYAPDAPDDVLNEAVILLVGYLLEAPGYATNTNVSTPTDPFRNSGAKPMLSDWHSPVSAQVG